MAKIEIPKQVRRDLVDRLEEVIAAVIATHRDEITEALAVAPWPALTEAERATWLLRREVQKALQQMRLRQDGSREKLRREALGKQCPRSGSPMSSSEEIELEHEEYDGRPPVAVHRKWHRQAQPH